MTKKIAAIILAMAISLVACKSVEATNTSWHLEFKNGVEGPSGVCELSADGSRILRTLSVGKAVEAANELPSMRVTVMNWPLPKEINGYATNNQKELSEGFIPSGPTIEGAWLDGKWETYRPTTPKEFLRIEPRVATNWTTIGTYTPLTGAPEDVQRGNIVTNTTAIFEWKGKRHELLLESVNGPGCGERRVPNPNQGSQYWLNITNSPLIGVLTNLYIDHIEATNMGQWFIQGQTNIGIQN